MVDRAHRQHELRRDLGVRPAVDEQAQDLDLPVGQPGGVLPGRGLGAARDHGDARPPQVPPHARGRGSGAQLVQLGRAPPGGAVGVALGQLQGRGVRVADRLPRRGGRAPVAADARRQLVGAAGEDRHRLAEAPLPPQQLAPLAFRADGGRALDERRDGRAGRRRSVEQPRLLDLGQQRGHQLVVAVGPPGVRDGPGQNRRRIVGAAADEQPGERGQAVAGPAHAAPGVIPGREHRAQPGLGRLPVATQRPEPQPVTDQVVEVEVQVVLAPVGDPVVGVPFDLRRSGRGSTAPARGEM